MTLRATTNSAGGARPLTDDAATLEALGLATGDRLEMEDSNEQGIANTLHDDAAAAGAGTSACISTSSPPPPSLP